MKHKNVLKCTGSTTSCDKQKKSRTDGIKKKSNILGKCESMYSLEDECCHTVARLASKLESGCRQLLYKLKSCEATQRECGGWEMCIMQTPRTSTCCLKHRCLESFPADYGYRGVRRSTVSQKLSIHHLWCFLGPSKDVLSVRQMRSQSPLAPCRLSRVTTLRGVTATGSLPKFWLYKAVVACSLTTCQVTVAIVELCLWVFCCLTSSQNKYKDVRCQRGTTLNHTDGHLKD